MEPSVTGNSRAGLAARWAAIQGRIAAAEQRAGRPAGAVQLVAVSKTHPVETLHRAYELGQRVFGENRVQEALGKMDAMGPGPEWHLIGHLQRNKVNAVVGRFALIHSVDSARLIEALDARARQLDLVQRVLLEINLGGEASKAGATEQEMEALLGALAQATHLRGEGLMLIPPYLEAEAVRPYFRHLRELLMAIGERPNFIPRELSMGMSHDFEVAIEEGATLVRVGSALFGERDYA